MALVSFCFSITSLAAFQRRALPLKLLVGFFSLFVSIFSMLISFCAAHVFELNPKHMSSSILLYLPLTSIPLCFYSTTQIPLYWDLLVAILALVPFSRTFYVGRQQQEADTKVVVEEVEEEEDFGPYDEVKRPIRKITRRTRQI